MKVFDSAQHRGKHGTKNYNGREHFSERSPVIVENEELADSDSCTRQVAGRSNEKEVSAFKRLSRLVSLNA